MFWKIYSIVWLLIYASELREPHGVLGWGVVIVSVLGIIGLICYSFKLRFFSPQFWRIVIWMLIASAVYCQIEWPERDVFILAIGFALILPAYVAVYRYGHSSRSIWARPNPAARNQPGGVLP